MSSAFHKVKSFSSRGKLGVGDPWIVDCVVDFRMIISLASHLISSQCVPIEHNRLQQSAKGDYSRG